MRSITVSNQALGKAGWVKSPGNTVYHDGHREGVIDSPRGCLYHYHENIDTTIFVPDGHS
mgnify:FL=1